MKTRRPRKNSFIGAKVPDFLSACLEQDAEQEGTTVSHIMRRILLAHYEDRKPAAESSAAEVVNA